MYYNKEDKNIMFMILAILIVSLIALIAMINIIGRLVAPPIQKAFNDIGQLIHMNRLDYNFAVPKVTIAQAPPPATILTAVANNPQPQQSGPVINYNFPVPNNLSTLIIPGDKNFNDPVLNDIKLADYSFRPNIAQGLSINIPILNINSPVVVGDNPSELLKQGFWVHPHSHDLGKGELLLICLRRYFDSNDPKSCYYLNQLNLDNEIFIKNGNNTTRYVVVGTNEMDEFDPLLYTVFPDDSYLKIITDSLINPTQDRLVILAKKEDLK